MSTHGSPSPSFYTLHPFLSFQSSSPSPQQSSNIAAQQSSLAEAVPDALRALSGPGPVADLTAVVNNISQQNAIQQPLGYAQYLSSLQTVLSAARFVRVQISNLTDLRPAVDTSNQVRPNMLCFMLTDVCMCFITTHYQCLCVLHSVTNLYNLYVVVCVCQNTSAQCHTQHLSTPSQTSCSLRDGLTAFIQETEGIETLVAGMERQAVSLVVEKSVGKLSLSYVHLLLPTRVSKEHSLGQLPLTRVPAASV